MVTIRHCVVIHMLNYAGIDMSCQLTCTCMRGKPDLLASLGVSLSIKFVCSCRVGTRSRSAVLVDSTSRKQYRMSSYHQLQPTLTGLHIAFLLWLQLLPAWLQDSSCCSLPQRHQDHAPLAMGCKPWRVLACPHLLTVAPCLNLFKQTATHNFCKAFKLLFISNSKRCGLLLG